MRRYLNKIDNEKLRDDMNSYDWYQDVCNDDLELNSCTANLITNLKDLCDRHAPRTSISKRKMKYCDKPWINKELLGLIRTKNTRALPFRAKFQIIFWQPRIWCVGS